MKRYFIIVLVLWLGAANAGQDDTPDIVSSVQIARQYIEQQTGKQASPVQVIELVRNTISVLVFGEKISAVRFGHALRIARDMLPYVKQVLGVEHPDTLAYQHALADLEKALESEPGVGVGVMAAMKKFSILIQQLERIRVLLDEDRNHFHGKRANNP